MLSSEPIEVEIPHEAGQWMKLRKLSWTKLREARKKQAKEQREIVKDFGADFMKVMAGGDEEKTRKFLERQEYHITNFDVETLLKYGIAEWSYDEPVNDEQIEELDEMTARWAAQEILNLVKPPDEEEEKNS